MFRFSLGFNITGNQFGFSFVNGMGAACIGTEILEQLYNDEQKDYLDSGYCQNWAISESIKDWENFRKLRIRFLSRVTSYVTTVCNVDGIILVLYTDLLSILKEIGGEELITDSEQTEKVICARKQEINAYRFYRNKVFAHTSYADPRKDSKSMQSTSLAYYSGSILSLGMEDCKHLSLGGGAIVAIGAEQGDPPDFPNLSIVGDYEKIVNHYTSWTRMFMEIFEKIDKDELRKKTGISLLSN